MDPGFQYALLASSTIDVKAPPIDIALDPTPIPKNWAAVVPTLDCEENPIEKSIIYKYLFFIYFIIAIFPFLTPIEDSTTYR